jgi:hypothetical protein
MTGTPPVDDLDPLRRRRLSRITIGAVIAATAIAVLTAVGGGGARAQVAVWLLVAATGCGIGALYGVVTAIVDEYRDRVVSRSRIVWTVGLFFAAAALMAMLAGVGG